MKNNRAAVLLLACAFAPNCIAQNVDNPTNVGTPENGLFYGREVDSVQLGNGNLHIEVPLFSVSGRGPAVQYIFVLDNKQWYAKITTNKVTGDLQAVIQPDPGGTLNGKIVGNFGYQVTFSHAPGRTSCLNGIGWNYNGVVREPNGTKHHLVPDPGSANSSCINPTAYYADDGSGFSDTSSLRTKNGTAVILPMTDTNGNQITWPTNGSLTDTLGRTYPANGYHDSAGNTQTVQTTTISVPVHTNLCQFVQGVTTCTENTGSATQIASITLPNGMRYSFTYVPNDSAQPSSMTLPSGAQVQWTWRTDDVGGPAVSTRTVIANGQNNAWTYNYSFDGGTNGFHVSSILDPLGNETDLTWQ